MKTADSLIYYPQYCFHLSPTINRWCPLRAIDIVCLGSQPGFEDIDVFFHLNHPIRWVRIMGVVVAIDHYYGHRVYTIDDSTGQCVECTVATPNANNMKIHHGDSRHNKITKPSIIPAKSTTVTHVTDTKATNTISTVASPIDIDIGMVLDVKGSVKIFRGQKQIKIEKVTQVLSTNEEVHFWNRIRDFRRDSLDQPWVLKDREVRRCRKLQQTETPGNEEKKTRNTKRHAENPRGGRGSSANGIHVSKGCSKLQNSISSASVNAPRAQLADGTEMPRSRFGGGDNYDALGL